MSASLNGVLKRPDDVLLRTELQRFYILQVLSDRGSSHSNPIRINEMAVLGMLDNVFKQCGDASHFVKVLHDIGARRLQIREIWSAVTDSLEIIDGKRHVGSSRHCEQMENGVRGASEDIDNSYGILKGLASQNVPELSTRKCLIG